MPSRSFSTPASGWWWRSVFQVFVLQGVILWIVSAPILTPALMRRYLLASGWADAPRGFMVKRGEQVGLFVTMTPFELDHEIEKIARLERVSRSEMAARLGVLAAAETNRAEAQGYEVKNTDEDGPREALLDVASKLVFTVGAPLEAWAKARDR